MAPDLCEAPARRPNKDVCRVAEQLALDAIAARGLVVDIAVVLQARARRCERRSTPRRHLVVLVFWMFEKLR